MKLIPAVLILTAIASAQEPAKDVRAGVVAAQAQQAKETPVIPADVGLEAAWAMVDALQAQLAVDRTPAGIVSLQAAQKTNEAMAKAAAYCSATPGWKLDRTQGKVPTCVPVKTQGETK